MFGICLYCGIVFKSKTKLDHVYVNPSNFQFNYSLRKRKLIRQQLLFTTKINN